jgi:acid stress-induced BolA-like protein IbaG/YrbA
MASQQQQHEEEEELSEVKRKLKATLEEGLKAERVSVESEGPREDRRLMLTVVSPEFRGLAKVEQRDDLIWRLIKAHAPLPSALSLSLLVAWSENSNLQ